jgi:inner membrane transporter RhtA
VPARGRTDAIPPQALILIGIASVQFGAAFADTLFDEAGPAGVVLMRLTFASVVLLALTRPRLAGRTRRDLLTAAGFGLVLGGMNWSFYEALHRLPLGPAVTVEFIGPLAVAIAGSRKLLDLVWVALAGVCWAAYILLAQRVGSSFAGLDGLAIALTLGALVLIPAGIVEGGSALLRPSVLYGGFWVAVLSSLIPYSLEIIALRRLSAAGFGLLMSLEPAFAALAGMLVLSQRPQLRTVAAIVMVVVASAGTTIEASRSAAKRDASAASVGQGSVGQAATSQAPAGQASTSQATPLG